MVEFKQYKYELIIDGQIINLTCQKNTAIKICSQLDRDCSVRLLDAENGFVYFENYKGDYAG